MKKTNITLKNIATKLNLSISTVSRALNNHPDISIKTKEKVKKVAAKWNYTPNIFAQGFRKHQTKMIGVIVPNLTHYFSATMVKGILEEAENKGYRVIITESNNQHQKQSEMLYAMLGFGVDGVLLSLTKNTQDFKDILTLLEKIPLILFDKVSRKVPCTQIVINEEEASFRAIEHLINSGKKRIAIIKEVKDSYNSRKRYEGYLRALKKYDISVEEELVIATEELSISQGKRITNLLLSLINPPDAVFAITDMMAIGVIKALKKYKIKIPADIAVVGFSNSIHSSIIEPKLTTVDQPGEKIGKTAVSYLIDEINNPEEYRISSKTVEINSSLIVRASSFLKL